MSRVESSHKWRGRIAAATVGGVLAVTAPYLIDRSMRGSHTTEVKPTKEQVTYEAIKELGNLQLLQRNMKGDFTLVALDHYKAPIVGWHYDPSIKLIGEQKEFKAEGQSYTVIDFNQIQIVRRQVIINGKAVEQVDAVLPEVKIGGSNVTSLDDHRNPQNGLLDQLSYRLNTVDKIKAQDMFNLADRDFRQNALEDEVLRSASENYARQIIAAFEAKNGFSFVNVSFADTSLPTLQVSEAQLSDGVEVQKRLVNADGTTQPFEDIQTIIARANAKIEANKAQNGGKYVIPTTTVDPRKAIEAEGYQP